MEEKKTNVIFSFFTPREQISESVSRLSVQLVDFILSCHRTDTAVSE